MLYIILLGLISTIGYMSLKSSYLYQEGMNSDKDKVNSIKLETLYKKEIILKDSINEYIEDKGEFPLDILTLKSEGYIGRGFDMSNVFNGDYINFEIVDKKIEIKQKIEDKEIRDKYITHIYNKSNKELGDEYKSYESGVEVIHKYKIRESGLNNLTKEVISDSQKSVLEKGLFLNCKEIKEYGPDLPDGVYKSKLGFDIYCDMSTDGGGWTLVWSNIKQKENNLEEYLNKSEITGSMPIYNGVISDNKFEFEVYTGLDKWNDILNNSHGEFMYQWSKDNINIDKEMISKIKPFRSDDNYRLELYDVRGDIGGLYNHHNNNELSVIGEDNDNNETFECIKFNRGVSFWYNNCKDGAINGILRGAYWEGSDFYYANDTSGDRGAGSGWFFIR